MARLSNLITDDIVFLPPNQSAVFGKKAVITWSEGFIEKFVVKETEVTFHKVEVVGDWAYLRMDTLWILVPKPEGESIQNIGKVLVICKRQSDGSWKFARDIWNNSPPPGAPTT
jgi:ketosteroid isomerase-like protein